MTVTLCTETAFNGDKKRFAGAVDNLAKRQFYGPVKSIVIDSHRPWVFCADFDFKGKAILLEPGEYNDISTVMFKPIVAKYPYNVPSILDQGQVFRCALSK